MSKCSKCNAKEVDAMKPRTRYACGSSDYDQRPNTFVQSDECKSREAIEDLQAVKDLKGEMKCKSEISFGDDFGDNESTFHCELKKGHKGKHQESGNMYGQPYILKWEGDKKTWEQKIDEMETFKD